MRHELTESERSQLVRDFADHPQFCRECLSLRNRRGSVVKMELEAGQRKLSAAIARAKKKNKPVRLVVLKTRRSYFTAGACAEIFHEVAFHKGRRATIIANNYKPAGLEAFDYMVQYAMNYTPMVRFGHRVNLPRVIKPTRLQSPVKEGADTQLLFENSASIDVLSAEGGDVGRGGGRHWLLGDEVAFWRNATITLTAVLNMIPDIPETGVILQSTANGIGGEFYNLCQKAMDPSNDGGWEFLFFGWLEHEPYRLELTNAEKTKLQDALDPDEKLLVSLHGATLEQLAWRRRTITINCRGDVDLFHQEYPTTPEEAWLASGHPVFSHIDLARHPIVKGTSGNLEVVKQGPRERILFLPRDDERGQLTVWAKPEKGRLYCGGADPSKGIDVSAGKRGENPDYSVAGIADTFTGELVALFRARMRPGPFGEYLAMLGAWYNWAFLNPEANDQGFIDSFINAGYPTELVYNRERDPHDRRAANIQELGFMTTTLSRSWLVGAAEEAVRSMSIVIHSSVVISECQTFEVKPTGKKEHRQDHHDDCVIMLGLTEIARRAAPRTPPAITQARPREPFVEIGRKRGDEHNRHWDEE